jgi:hypothetical protein
MEGFTFRRTIDHVIPEDTPSLCCFNPVLANHQAGSPNFKNGSGIAVTIINERRDTWQKSNRSGAPDPLEDL